MKNLFSQLPSDLKISECFKLTNYKHVRKLRTGDYIKDCMDFGKTLKWLVCLDNKGIKYAIPEGAMEIGGLSFVSTSTYTLEQAISIVKGK